jgi:hypothetical protein
VRHRSDGPAWRLVSASNGDYYMAYDLR